MACRTYKRKHHMKHKRKQRNHMATITLPSSITLPSPYTDDDILSALGNYTQEFGTPLAEDWNYLIVAFSKARYASLNPSRQTLFNEYAGLGLDGKVTEQKAILDAALASDQPYIDEEIDLQLGGNGAANPAPGTTMAMRRFAYGYLSGPAYNPAPNPPPPTLPPSGPIPYTLVPPPPYAAPASAVSATQPPPYAGP
jgi:hypothetical protein